MSIRTIRRETDRIARISGQILRRGIVGLMGSDYLAQIRGYTDEFFDRVELWQTYGLASRPPIGAEILIGKPDHSAQGAIAIADNARGERPSDLEDSEVCLYGKLNGSDQSQIRMRPTGDIDLLAPGSGDTVNVGGSSEALALGDTLKGKFDALSASVAALVPGTDLGTLRTFQINLKTALGTFTSGASGWVATKAKGS